MMVADNQEVAKTGELILELIEKNPSVINNTFAKIEK
jgi:hypothetical protein